MHSLRVKAIYIKVAKIKPALLSHGSYKDAIELDYVKS